MSLQSQCCVIILLKLFKINSVEGISPATPQNTRVCNSKLATLPSHFAKQGLCIADRVPTCMESSPSIIICDTWRNPVCSIFFHLGFNVSNFSGELNSTLEWVSMSGEKNSDIWKNINQENLWHHFYDTVNVAFFTTQVAIFLGAFGANFAEFATWEAKNMVCSVHTPMFPFIYWLHNNIFARRAFVQEASKFWCASVRPSVCPCVCHAPFWPLFGPRYVRYCFKYHIRS